MTRIIAGTAKGRRLAVPAGAVTRPTSDRAREGLFGTVQALLGPLDGLGVLDLYAGSGAVGLEALSRGAGSAVFVESDARAAQVIRANMARAGLPGGVLIQDRVLRVLARGPGDRRPFELVAADPPYAAGQAEVAAVLTELALRGWVAGGGLVAVERATRSGPLAWPAGYQQDRSRRYGEATIWYGLAAGP